MSRDDVRDLLAEQASVVISADVAAAAARELWVA